MSSRTLLSDFGRLSEYSLLSPVSVALLVVTIPPTIISRSCLSYTVTALGAQWKLILTLRVVNVFDRVTIVMGV